MGESRFHRLPFLASGTADSDVCCSNPQCPPHAARGVTVVPHEQEAHTHTHTQRHTHLSSTRRTMYSLGILGSCCEKMFFTPMSHIKCCLDPSLLTTLYSSPVAPSRHTPGSTCAPPQPWATRVTETHAHARSGVRVVDSNARENVPGVAHLAAVLGARAVRSATRHGLTPACHVNLLPLRHRILPHARRWMHTPLPSWRHCPRQAPSGRRRCCRRPCQRQRHRPSPQPCAQLWQGVASLRRCRGACSNALRRWAAGASRHRCCCRE